MADIIFISDILLVSIAFLWLITASVTDLRKREVPNWLSFSLIFIAFAVRALAAIMEKQAPYFWYALAAFAIFYLLAHLFYYTRIFGGGDAKLLMALSVVFATQPIFASHFQVYSLGSFNEPFLLIFLINIFFIGSIYGLFFSIFSAIRNKTFGMEFQKTFKRIRFFRTISWLIAAIALTLSLFDKSWFFIPFIVFLILPLLYSFIKAAENSAMIRKVPASKLSEGDWIIESVKIKNKMIKPSIHGLSKKDIQLLRKSKKKITIKYGLPFVPVFLIALICSLFVGDLLFIIIHYLFGI
ncbi:MAG: prepilin peptidase [Candidatus Pacearchaeota archaeon]|nr:MAG: prepilin peptidase [Candidatus Pacearchaeota archaeon]